MAKTSPGHEHTVTRFAPSPNGYLHLGHAYAALVAWHRARASGGRFLLRLEDIDRGRARPQFEAAIYQDLAWLGLAWETPVRRQSEHFGDYRAALDVLDGLGVTYPCFCTRKDIQAEIAAAGDAPHDSLGGASGEHIAQVYPGTCRALNPGQRARRLDRGEPHALRLDVAKAMTLAAAATNGPLVWWEFDADGGAARQVPCEAAGLGDVVLARRDMPTSYHLAVTVDDHLQGVTLVTRGRDLAPATHIQRLLQALLGTTTPGYLHHRLIGGEGGEKLSKRKGSASLRDLRASPTTVAEVWKMLGFAPD